MVMWEARGEGGRGNNYGSLAADLDMAARGDGVDDFPAVADCLNLGSFAEESPPRAPRRRSPKASPQQYEQGQPYHYRSSPQPPPPYPPGSGPPHMYYQGPPAGSPYAYPPHTAYPPYRGYPPQGEQPPLPWASTPAQQFAEYPPPDRSPRRGSPPPKKRHNWDSNTSSPESSTTPEKVFPEKPSASPFRSPLPSGEKGSTKKYKRSPLFPGGGTPGISQFGSWDTPGGTLNSIHAAALGDEFSPMGAPFIAPFGDESPLREGETAPMPFDAKLELARSDSGEDAAANRPPAIRQRPTGQPSASPFSTFVGELSPFPPHMRGPPISHDPRDYA